MFSLSYELTEILKNRAESFLKNSERLINEGEWDLAVFNLEQYCQLILKYSLLMKKGTYARTHSLRSLIRDLGSMKKDILKLVEDEHYLHFIARIEEAYVASRYLPYSYEEKEVKSLYNFVVKVFKPLIEG
ncbi:MAG: HEPN domain-containing protein [Candidatus Bathyarchaeia archaeon]|nr:HEPN domain-containing protein [Candidatus Verstraetearchaeota archaeon]